MDISERALNHARERANVVGSQITFTQLDVLKQPLPSLSFDVVVCSLFLHHLDNEQGKQLLTAMRDVTHHLLVVSDLVRNRRGLLLTELAVRLFTSSDVVRVDGARGVFNPGGATIGSRRRSSGCGCGSPMAMPLRNGVAQAW